MYLRKYLLHEKVSIIAPTDVLAMPVPSTPTLYYVDPPYYFNNYDRNPYFKAWKEDDTVRDRFWMQMKTLADADSIVAVSEYTCDVPGCGFVPVWTHANPKKGKRVKRGDRRDEQLYVSA